MGNVGGWWKRHLRDEAIADDDDEIMDNNSLQQGMSTAPRNRLSRSGNHSNTPPTIDLKIGACDEFPLITSKENGSIGNIRRLSQSLQRDALGKLLAVLRRVVDTDKGREQLRGR